MDSYEQIQQINRINPNLINNKFRVERSAHSGLSSMNNRELIKTYKFGTEIISSAQLPVPFSDRTGTDVFCTVLTAIFSITLLIIAVVQFNIKNLQMMTYPTDSMGRKCTFDNPKFNYLYFTNLDDHNKRVCVAECPKGSQDSLKCWPTDEIGCAQNNDPNFQVDIYPTYLQETRLGLFCVPENKQFKEKLYSDSKLINRFQFIDYQTSLFISLGISFLLGLIFLGLLFVAAQPMVFVSIGLGALSALFAGIFMIIHLKKFDETFAPLIIIIFVLLLLLALLLTLSLIFRRQNIRGCGRYISRSMIVLKDEPTLLVIIIIFLVLQVGLFALCLFELLANWSSLELQFTAQSIYYEPVGTFAEIQKILIIFELIWGFFFLKEAFSYIVSGCGITYKFYGRSSIRFGLKGLFQYHWGSVVGSSILRNFFYFPDVIYDVIKPKNKNSSAYRTFKKICCCCDRIFGFVRSETMAFINMTGLPYCNSSRWCEKIIQEDKQFIGSQSYYRSGSQALLCLLSTFLAFFNHIIDGTVHPVGLIFSFIANYFVITFFVSLSADLAETLLISELIENYIRGQDNLRQTPYIQHDPKKMMRQSNRDDDGYDVLPTRN